MSLAVALTCLFVSAAAAAVLAYWSKSLHKYWRIFQLSKQFVGPPTLPLIGSAHLFFNMPPWQELKTLLELLQRYGETMKLWLGCDFFVFVSAPRDVEAVLGGSTALLAKSKEYDILRAWLNDGLLISAGQKWHCRRKLLTPAFHFRILEQFVDTFERQTRIFVECLHADTMHRRGDGENWVDIGFRINLLSLDIICETAMGVAANAQTKQDSTYVQAVKLISTVLYKRATDVLYRFTWLYKLSNLAREEKKALAVLHGFTEKIIEQRCSELLKSQESESNYNSVLDIRDEETTIGVKRKMNFLDILLHSQIDGKPLSNLDIREEVDTFMFEGHDTTSSAMTFFFYNLARYPACQQKCYEEIVTVFGADQKSKSLTIEELNKLHYVELCIKETLRLFPSVPLLGRKVSEEININGKIIPAGVSVLVSPLQIGRLATHYPEPHLFRPERFEVGSSSAERLNAFSFIPFSAGPRNCIGQKFAMLEIKCVVLHVLQNFVVEYAGNPDEELQLVAPLILNTMDPIKFKLKPRGN